MLDLGTTKGPEVVMTTGLCSGMVVIKTVSLPVQRKVCPGPGQRDVGGMGDTLFGASASQSQVGRDVWILTGLCSSEQVAHGQPPRPLAFF